MILGNSHLEIKKEEEKEREKEAFYVINPSPTILLHRVGDWAAEAVVCNQIKPSQG